MARRARPQDVGQALDDAATALDDARDQVDRHVARWQGEFAGFDPEVEGAIVRMGQILRHIKAANVTAFAELGVNQPEYDTLHQLLIEPYPNEATPAQLAEACHVTRAAMTSRLDRLVEQGLVTREGDVVDRRRVLVRPTPQGSKLWKTALEHAAVQENATIGALGQREKHELNTLLRKITLALENQVRS